ncbi:endonuclease/exonuclease/phosphatase family protein [Piscinibacter terrae]|uniref:endonuclease/exonuclease/phosphatase family protein n=1 Tax=Piscinibacter terrae TaxID=2496871 RepID=UPI000F5A8510|nr:hypothetical protein [Albitalea terrae]
MTLAASTGTPSLLQLGVAWWNTALSPNVDRGRAKAEELEAAALMLTSLVQMGAQFVVLGEVASEDVIALEGLCSGLLQGCVFCDSTSKAGRGRFDTCAVYRADMVRVESTSDLVQVTGGRTARIGQHFTLTVEHETKPVHLLASHWPSRLQLSSNAPGRYALATRLRDKVDVLLEEDSEALIVLLGDYNDEPFDSCIAETLRATRDRDLAMSKSGLLYNPFWRHLSSFEHIDSSHRVSDRGTYFHLAGDVTRWRTFDHMMFSAAFLCGAGGWRLDEHGTRVVNLPQYTKLVEARKNVFDHLPIIGRAARRL